MDGKTCYLCNDAGDLRPYGPKGQWVCYPCGTSPAHLSQTKAAFGAQLKAAGSMVAIGSDLGPMPLASAFPNHQPKEKHNEAE